MLQRSTKGIYYAYKKMLRIAANVVKIKIRRKKEMVEQNIK
jgi:hypothetical protein